MPRLLDVLPATGLVVSRSKPTVFHSLPELTAWLADGAYPDGKPVGMVQLSIRPKGVTYVVQLRIQDQGGMVLTVEDTDLGDAFVLLEAALIASPTPWSRDPYPLGVSQSKKK